jgi:hypothetical protein
VENMNIEESITLHQQKIEDGFADMTKEDIIACLVSHVNSRTRSIHEWEAKGKERKGRDKRECFSIADRERTERQLITRLHINLDKVSTKC